MSEAEDKFFREGGMHRTFMLDEMQRGKADHPGTLNFGAFRQGRDPQYLGIVGRTYYGKPWGNDSSNVQAVLNGPSYWKRVYYRPNMAKEFQRQDREDAERLERAENKRLAEDTMALPRLVPGGGAAQASSSSKTMARSRSEGAVRRQPEVEEEEPVDGYENIKKSMRPFVEHGGKPRIKKPEVGERLHFFNTLHGKYQMQAAGKNIRWNVEKGAHRSRKHEVNWILSNYFRTDTQAVLSGSGSAPSLSAT